VPPIGKQFAAMEVSLLRAYKLQADNATPGSLAFDPGIQVIGCQEVMFEPGTMDVARWVGDNEVLRLHSRIKNLKGRFVCASVAGDALAFIQGGTNTSNANTQQSVSGTVTPQATWTWTVPANPTFPITAGTWNVTFNVQSTLYWLTITNGATTYTSPPQASANASYNFIGTGATGLVITVSASPGSPVTGTNIGTFAITNSSAGATTSTNVTAFDGTDPSYFKIETLLPYAKDMASEVGANARLLIPKCKIVGGPQLNFNGNPTQTAINWECVRPTDPNSRFWAQLTFGESVQALSA
jgi:hypothetical protein